MSRVGLRAPEDLSVLGFDDHAMAAPFGLSTIAQPVAGAGRAGRRRWRSTLAAGRTLPRGAVVLPTRLVPRRTADRAGPRPPGSPKAPPGGRTEPRIRTRRRYEVTASPAPIPSPKDIPCAPRSPSACSPLLVGAAVSGCGLLDSCAAVARPRPPRSRLRSSAAPTGPAILHGRRSGRRHQAGELQHRRRQPRGTTAPSPGCEGDERLVGIDYRVQDGKLYGVGDAGGVYTIDDTGAATKVKQLSVELRRGELRGRLQPGRQRAADHQRHRPEPAPAVRRRRGPARPTTRR